MSNVTLEEVMEEAQALPPEEQEQLRHAMNTMVGLLLAGAVLHILEKANSLSLEDRRQFRNMLNRWAVDASGPETKVAAVRGIRGKYAHLPTSSEAFAARKQEEMELEDRRRAS